MCPDAFVDPNALRDFLLRFVFASIGELVVAIPEFAR
jgi:hypothetical protein